tara:strand:- start:438 stop:575 length:138 start_codon:yes stop_codon:yes gene_type:complete
MARKELLEHSAYEKALLAWPVGPNWAFAQLGDQYSQDNHHATDLQ